MKTVREAHIPAGLKAAGPNPKSAIRMMNQVAPGINGTIVLLEGAEGHEIIGLDIVGNPHKIANQRLPRRKSSRRPKISASLPTTDNSTSGSKYTGSTRIAYLPLKSKKHP